MQPDLTSDELAALGYIVEAYDREADNTTEIEIRYMATAPDGQLIAEDLATATEAWGWARWHDARNPAPRAADADGRETTDN